MPAAVPSPATPLEVTDVHGLLCAIENTARAGRVPLVTAAHGQSANPVAIVADTVHFLMVLHGELPSVFDLVAQALPELTDPIASGAGAFAADREWLTRLVVLTGPRLDLTGISDAETTVRALRDALLTLATSSRDGCALGTLLTVFATWSDLVDALDTAGTLAFSARWPSRKSIWSAETLDTILTAAEALYAERPRARAIAFGAQQCGLLHQQLLELVSARAASRSI